MKIGIGLPNPVPDTPGDRLLEWARRADTRGFSSLATIDRLAFPSYESLIALAGAAAITERIGLLTNVLLAPTRNPVLLAKEAASLDQLSGGRLTLGLGVGLREDDFELAERSFHDRGRRFDQDLERMHAVWRGAALTDTGHGAGPRPVNGTAIPILVGGMSDATVRRTIRWGRGWTAGGAPPDAVAPMVERVRTAWSEAGREGEPRLVALAYVGLGPEAQERARVYLTSYYARRGDRMAASTPTSPQAVRDLMKRFEDTGVGELILDPTVSDPDEVDRLADAAL